MLWAITLGLAPAAPSSGPAAAPAPGFVSSNRAPASPLDIPARAQFIAIEQCARLAHTQQAEQLPRLYRDLAPPLLNWAIEGIVSSMPAHLLVRDRLFAGNDFPAGYLKELNAAAGRMTPEEVADTILANHHNLILRVAARRRCIDTLLQHKPEVVKLVATDLASQQPEAVRRGFNHIAPLRLSEFLDQTVSTYLQNGPFAEDARTALVWLNDLKAVKPLLQDIEAHPDALKRHFLLLNGMLRAGLPSRCW